MVLCFNILHYIVYIWFLQGFCVEIVATITCVVGWSWTWEIVQIIVGLQHFGIAYYNNQKSIVHIYCYHTHGTKLWSFPSNVGHDQTFQMIELQTRMALEENHMSDPLYQYPLEWHDWTPKRIKANIQNSCTNIFFSLYLISKIPMTCWPRK